MLVCSLSVSTLTTILTHSSKHYTTFYIKGLQELEATLPPSVTQIKIDESIKLSKTNEKTPEARRERALKEQLERMNMKWVERKERQNQVKPPLKYAVKIEKPAVRPPTPTIRVP